MLNHDKGEVISLIKLPLQILLISYKEHKKILGNFFWKIYYPLPTPQFCP